MESPRNTPRRNAAKVRCGSVKKNPAVAGFFDYESDCVLHQFVLMTFQSRSLSTSTIWLFRMLLPSIRYIQF